MHRAGIVLRLELEEGKTKGSSSKKVRPKAQARRR